MAVATVDHIHRYPRRIRWGIELLTAVAVGLATFIFGRDLLRYLWHEYGVKNNLVSRLKLPRLDQFFDKVVDWLNVQRAADAPTELRALIPALTILGIALLGSLLLRNAFPTIRTSDRGMLVEFSNGWLPLGWEDVAVMKVTQDLNSERYVLLLQSRGRALTGWHRIYSFIYRLGLGRGFWITSAIDKFEDLVKTILNEIDAVGRIGDLKPAKVEDKGAASPLFQFLLNPMGFFMRRTPAEQAAAPAPAPAPAAAAAPTTAARPQAPAAPADPSLVVGTYPRRIQQVLAGVTGILAGALLLSYLARLRAFIGLIWGGGPAFFTQARTTFPESNFWVLLAAHLMLLFTGLILIVIWRLLPDLRAQNAGLEVRHLNKWLLIPWEQITAVKAIDLSEHNHVLLIQTTNRALRPWHRVASFLFDAGKERGVVVTSAISNFDSLLQRIMLGVSRNQSAVANNAERGVFQDDAPAWVARLLFKPSETIDQLVAETKDDNDTLKFAMPRIRPTLHIPILLALAPALLLTASLFIDLELLPSLGRIVLIIGIFLWGMLEWPLIATLAAQLEENVGFVTEGDRPYYLYPTVQIPRLIPMVGALIFALIGIPIVPTLFWLGAAAWSFLLTAALWEELYHWQGVKLLMMGLAPAIFQILTMILVSALS